MDDAIALFMGFVSPELEILALTTTAGNVDVHKTTRNTLGLCALAGLQIPVFRGATGPMLGDTPVKITNHGVEGLGEFSFGTVPELTTTEYAWDAIYRLARARKGLTVLALGPLTNLAIALVRHPDLPRYVSRVISMGGAVGYGNTTACSEFNYWFDPLAAKIVLDSPLEVFMVGLNATRQTTLTQDEMATLGRARSPALEAFLQTQRTWFLERLRRAGMPSGFHIPDAAAMAYAIDPRVLEFRSCPVEVSCDEGPVRGWTIVDLRGWPSKKKKTHVAMKADKSLYINILSRLHVAQGGEA